MATKYILKDKTPIVEPDLVKWARWYDRADRNVALDQIGESRVSTVFLGIDSAVAGGEPVLWDTRVFGGPLHQEQERCGGSWEQAEAMHARMVERVKSAMGRHGVRLKNIVRRLSHEVATD